MTVRKYMQMFKLPPTLIDQRLGLQSSLFALVVACVLSGGSQAQQKQEKKKDAQTEKKQQNKEETEKKREAARKAAIKQEAVRRQAVRVQHRWTDENFDQWVFQQDRNASTARKRLGSMLVIQLEGTDRASPLTDPQKQKLQLAGRGDVKRFFDRYETVKQKFHLIKDDQQKFQEIWQDINPLQTALQAGLFDSDSLFYKSLHNTLTDDQRARHDVVDRERREFSHRASIALAVNTWEQSVPLRDAQRRDLITLLTNQTKMPRKSGSYDYYLIMYQLSQLAEEKLKPHFDEMQWKIVGQQLAQAKGWGQFLKTAGVLASDEDDKADAQPAPANK
jgi:hypothetical protein